MQQPGKESMPPSKQTVLPEDKTGLRRRVGKRIRNYLLPASDAEAREPPREDTDFMPETLAALFQRPPAPTFLVIRGTLLLIIIAVIWAAFSDLDEITVGEGKIIPSSQVQVIQNMEGGIISAIPVKIGELVQQGQIVIQLDETRFASSAGESKAKHLSLAARVARLTAEASGLPFNPPESLRKEDPKILADEQILYNNRLRELDATKGVLRQQIDQRSQEISEKRARLKQLQESFGLISQELKMSKPLLAEGVLSEVEILRIQRQVSETRGEMDATQLAIPRLEAQLIEARTKLDGAVAKFRSDASTELSQAKADLAGTSASSIAVDDRLARTAIRSPLTGIVKQIKINTVGGVLQPGMEVMEIVPLEDKLLIEAKVRPSDVGFLRPGLPTMVKVSAYDFSIYGGLDGTLENITADSITNEKGESFYLVRVRTTRNSLNSNGKQLPIIPGMLATVHIRTGHKSVLSYLLKPVIKAKNDALRER